MRREWESEELIASWTLGEGDEALVGNKIGATLLGFALLLKFVELAARFSRYLGETPEAAVSYVALQAKVQPRELGSGGAGRLVYDGPFPERLVVAFDKDGRQ